MATSNNCDICISNVGCYTCPRCNILYCSTTCYQSNSHIECSEMFFKQCVDEMLQSTPQDPHKKQQLEQALSNQYNLNSDLDEIDQQLLDSDDDEDEDVVSLEERLKGVDLDDSELLWSKLTEKEKKEYFQFLQNGELDEVLGAIWKPFWLEKIDGKVVEINQLDELKKKCPKLVKIKHFKTISKIQPAECVQYNLINILTAYAFTARYFSGDHFKEGPEAVACICNISLVFKSSGKYDSFEEAFKSVVYEYKNLNWIHTSEENEKLLTTDLDDILKGPHVTEKNFYILCCLSDLSQLFKNVLKEDNTKTGEFKKQFESEQIQFEKKDRIKTHIKKLDYYLSYVKDVYCSS